MQTIPLLYAVADDRKVMVGPAEFDGREFSVRDPQKINTVSRLKTGAERGKVLLVDTVGVNVGKFNASFIEYCRVPGNDLWLVEPVYDDIDVLDAFIGYADKIVFPYDDIRGDEVLKDILEISDNCVPLLFIRNGKCKGGDPARIADRLVSLGFHNIVVADLDGSVTDDAWDMLQDICGGLICYSPRREIGIEPHIKAEDVFPLTFTGN